MEIKQGINGRVIAAPTAAVMKACGEILQAFLNSEVVTEIMVNPDGKIYVEELGTGMRNTGLVMSEVDRDTIAKLIVATNRKLINESTPSATAIWWQYRARVQVFSSPVVPHTALCIRLPRKKQLNIEDYVATGQMKAETASTLTFLVTSRKNVLISGGTGSGKTTLLNALLSNIDARERIFIVEDTPEVTCTVENKVAIEVNDNYSFQRAIKDALRSRPDRIIVGEVRDGAALDLLKAMNTGHSGCMGTIHANSARAVPERLMQLMGEVVVTPSRALIAEAVNYVVHLVKRHGQYAIGEFVEFEPRLDANGEIVIREKTI